MPAPRLALALTGTLLLVAVPPLSARDGWGVMIPPLDVQEKNLVDVVRFIEETANVNVLVDEALHDTKISLQLQTALPWLDCLHVIAEIVGGELRLITEETVRLYLPPRVSLEFDGATLGEACAVIARSAGLNVVVPGDLATEKRVTFNLENVSWRDALEVVAHSCGAVLVEEADGRVLRLARPHEVAVPGSPGTFLVRLEELEAELTAMRAELEAGLAAQPPAPAPWVEPDEVSPHPLTLPQGADASSYLRGWLDGMLAAATERFQHSLSTGDPRGFHSAILLQRGAEAALAAYRAAAAPGDPLLATDLGQTSLAQLRALADRARTRVELLALPLALLRTTVQEGEHPWRHTRAVFALGDRVFEATTTTFPDLTEHPDLRLLEIRAGEAVLELRGEQRVLYLR